MYRRLLTAAPNDGCDDPVRHVAKQSGTSGSSGEQDRCVITDREAIHAILGLDEEERRSGSFWRTIFSPAARTYRLACSSNRNEV